MKKPTLIQVVEHFKNAKVVECAYTKNEVDISINIQKEPYPLYDEYWMDLEKSYYKQVQFNLWDEDTGYAKIISYKEACGIETEPGFMISKEQIEEIHAFCEMHCKESADKFKGWFPEAFETVLEVRKWYKKNWKDGDVDLFHVYYFNEDGTVNDKGQYWRNGVCKYWKEKNRISKDDRYVLSEATESEVFEALKGEVVKRYKSGDFLKCIVNGYLENIDTVNLKNINDCFKSINEFWIPINAGNQNACVFKDGQWAEIIPSISREQAEKELGKKIIN